MITKIDFNAYHDSDVFSCTLKYKRTDRCDLRSEHLLEIPYANTYNYGINYVLFRGSILWNSINNDIKTAENLNVFKRITKEWNGDKCNCKICQ